MKVFTEFPNPTAVMGAVIEAAVEISAEQYQKIKKKMQQVWEELLGQPVPVALSVKVIEKAVAKIQNNKKSKREEEKGWSR